MSGSADRRQRKRDRTAAHLSSTAFALFEAHGYDSVSMEQIADEADVAKATLYKYFPVKEALLAHRFREDIAAGMVDRAGTLAAHTTFDARMHYLLRESAAWHAQRRVYLPHYLRFLTNRAHYAEQGSDPAHSDSGSWQILVSMFRAAQDSGEVTTSQSAEQIAWSFQYLLFGAISGWLIDPSRDLTEPFLAAFDLAMHGVAQPPQTAQETTKARAKR